MNGDYVSQITECKNQLSNIEERIKKDRFDSFVQYLVSYAVIKSCGTIETIYKAIIVDHLTQGANLETKNYLEKNIKESSSNPKTGNIKNMLEIINVEWSKKFEEELKGDDNKGYLNSLVQLRNDFSHGKNITVSIETVIKYFDGATNILGNLNNIIKK